MGWLVKKEDFQEKESLVDHLNVLYQEENVFVMDNHLAAGWCWYMMLDKNGTYSFCHIDQHDDLASDHHQSAIELFSKNETVNIKDYVSLLNPQRAGSSADPSKVFRWDNYILHMKSVFPKWFTQELYACQEFITGEKSSLTQTQPLEKEYDFDMGEILIPKHPINVNCYSLCSTLAEEIDRFPYPCIVNFDIDYFFRNHVQIFTDEYIRIICNQIAEKMGKIAVLTIALSPECCGGWENAIRVYNIIAEQLNLQMTL